MVPWIHEPETGLSMPFGTETDALLASAYLWDDVVGEIVEGFLEIVNKEDFDPRQATVSTFTPLLHEDIAPDREKSDPINSLLHVVLDPLFDVKDITFRRSDEIDTRISEHRAKSTVSFYGHSAGMPMAVLQGVTDVFEREYYRNIFGSGAFHIMYPSETSSEELASPRPSRQWNWHNRNPAIHRHSMPKQQFGKSLLAMSLVHRTWTKVVQQALRKHIFIRAGSELSSFLRNPHCGPWVKSLWISCSNIVEEDQYRDCRCVAEERADRIYSHHLVSLFSRAPNLIHLVTSLHTRGETIEFSETVNMKNLLAALTRSPLRNLQVFEHASSLLPRDTLHNLLQRICEYKNLSFLVLLRTSAKRKRKRRQFQDTPIESLSFDDLSLPRGLKSIHSNFMPSLSTTK